MYVTKLDENGAPIPETRQPFGPVSIDVSPPAETPPAPAVKPARTRNRRKSKTPANAAERKAPAEALDDSIAAALRKKLSELGGTQ